ASTGGGGGTLLGGSAAMGAMLRLKVHHVVSGLGIVTTPQPTRSTSRRRFRTRGRRTTVCRPPSRSDRRFQLRASDDRAWPKEVPLDQRPDAACLGACSSS